MMLDSHNLTGDAAKLRAFLLQHSEMGVAAVLAEELVNTVNEALNAANVSVGTSLLARALVARGVVDLAADWWESGDDPLATLPTCTDVMRSFITDLPPSLIGEAYNPEEEG